MESELKMANEELLKVKKKTIFSLFPREDLDTKLKYSVFRLLVCIYGQDLLSDTIFRLIN